MAVNDTTITDWEVTRDANDPKSSSRIGSDLAKGLRNIKSVYRRDVSLNKGWLILNPSTSVTTTPVLPGVYLFTLTGEWTSYLTNGRKVRLTRPGTNDHIYGHVVIGGVAAGITAKYSGGKTSAWVRLFSTFDAAYSTVSFGVDNAYPAIYPLKGVAGSFKHTYSAGDDDPESGQYSFAVTFEAVPATPTNYDPPKIELPRNLIISTQASSETTGKVACVDAFVQANVVATDSSQQDARRIVKITKLRTTGFTVTLAENPAYPEEGNPANPYVIVDYTITLASDTIPITAQSSKLGIFAPG